MMSKISCPYCHKTFQKEAPECFEACPWCGYRSAHIESTDGAYLIIDSNLPDLIGKYRQLQEDNDSPVVVIDRRVGHNQVAGNERRRCNPS